MLPKPFDMTDDVPADFPRFFFPGHEREAILLSHYAWYHFKTRPGNGKTLFNKEYLTTTDCWLGGARDERRGKTIQDVHREDISAMQLDTEGYVHTHQHFSHAHDYGWPFPLWPQVPGGIAGQTAGWHFQHDGPGWMWVWGMLKNWPDSPHYSDRALVGWELDHLESLGIVDGKWRLRATGPSPALTTPAGTAIDAHNAPFLQLRWTRTGAVDPKVLPYVEWLRAGDDAFGADRRVHFDARPGEYDHISNATHSIVELYRHPQWEGRIERIRLALAPGESDVEFGLDSFFTCYDTRHTINNPIFILATWNLFRWTGDVDFLRANIERMRRALRYQQTELGGLEHNLIRNPWVGHDGRPGFFVNPDGSKTPNPGHGIGNNYWDLLPFGGDDFYATYQYYAATLAMSDVEEAIRAHPEWDVARDAGAFDPRALRRHAAAVKTRANRAFWSRETGRFVACIDTEGQRHDYGFTFVNLDAIWYGIAGDAHARAIMDWIAGERIVEGDTSTGADIYHWRFGPRATTRRNVEWYGQCWTGPETIPWGGQVQDGGAVLGFSFYDLWARLLVRGPDDAWARLAAILDWEEEVHQAGGYREYYKDGRRGTTLQGCNTAGGLGIDCEFYESCLIPSIVVYGFLGLEPTADALVVAPRLPSQCPEMAVSNLLYRGTRLDLKAGPDCVAIEVKDEPGQALRVVFPQRRTLASTGKAAKAFALDKPGIYRFVD